jgi:DNA-binding response OmpR family regulator
MPHHHTNGHSDSASQVRFLYVGEDLAVIRYLRTAFHGPEYHVVSCPDRDSAERFIKSDIRYHLFIFDHEMRHRAAFDLARLVRSLKHRDGLPAIIVGTEVESSLNEFTRASGGDQYVQKAESFSAIQSAIKQLLLSSTESAINVSGTASCPDLGS